MTKEYQVFLLDERYELFHKGDVLFESDNLDMAITFAYNKHCNDDVETCVYQPRAECYRDFYKIERFQNASTED
jgi:hypothetical protein